ncbi:unnamed protein product [Adineta ricciae]|uniref:Uncharacterized protein n=1 Tax=Adineta ricciae TaxID=249248 RepID=A0A815UWV0_ADIRI|nr:unnamed protein product [Adineta ricciae]CAF1579867.1 unnamed protein product [Adineta ricciae]
MQFAELYTRRHVVQVVHSVIHIPATVKDFGPLTNFTTFNFESILGKITRTTKGTRRHAEEMISSLHYLQAGIVHLKQSSLDVSLENFISTELYYTAEKPHYGIRLLHETNLHHDLSSMYFPQALIKTFHVLYIGHVRISTIQYADGKKSDDSSIIFRLNGRPTFGRVASIFTAETQQPLLLVNYFDKSQPLRCNLSVNGPEFHYNRILSVDTRTRNTSLISTSDFMEKCVYLQPSNNFGHFYQFPTPRHST